MKDIRTLTVEKIRAYHKEYYRPDNMCVCITGKVYPTPPEPFMFITFTVWVVALIPASK